MKFVKSIVASAFAVIVLSAISHSSFATLVNISNCGGTATSCSITSTPPNPIIPNPNNNLLLAWDEVQNITLTQDLVVDRVFDPNASFVTNLGNGTFSISAGTVVSSHYIQWDPDTPQSVTADVQATIELDSQAFAIINTDQSLFASDFLGLANLNYNNFTLRGLEVSDITSFNGTSVDIDWSAGDPGDWARLITAFSPGAPVPTNNPSTIIMFLLSFACVVVKTQRKRA